jgi:ferredoxin-type protein NapH
MRKFSTNEVVASKGWFGAYKWLLLRRLTQLSILGLFLVGPWFGLWIVKGNLASSLTLDVLPLTDPYVLLQSLFAWHPLETTALIGALIVLIFYLLIGGRVYCSWVCPINIVTDAAASLRERLNIKGGTQLSRTTRYWILGITFIVASITGTIAWELINPVSMIYRGLIFGMGLAWGIVIAIFLFDLLISKNGWCGHLCPVGAFYSLLGKFSFLRIRATQRAECDNCMDCFRICPEPQVIKPALKGAKQGIGPMILSANCTNCGQCIDICTRNVFNLSTRFHNKELNIEEKTQ